MCHNDCMLNRLVEVTLVLPCERSVCIISVAFVVVVAVSSTVVVVVLVY